MNAQEIIHLTVDAVTTLCGRPAAGVAIHAHYGDRELDRGTWCERCQAARKGGRRIEYHGAPNEDNRCSFTLHWTVDGEPRGQCFFADPRTYGFPLPA